MPHHPPDLPSLRSTVRLGGKGSDDTTSWYDVKFYPYTPPGVDPVFAVVGGRDTLICRCVLEKANTIEVIRWFKDEEEGEDSSEESSTLNSVEWAQAENGDPLVCVTGSIAKIKILNVKSGELVTTLIGHGMLINDLAICPLTPQILASASMDRSIRIWSLDPKHEKSPTMLICGGSAHKEGLLTIGYHRTGRYLLSGGFDTMVNLWVIPELPNENAGTDKPTLIHYPHFSTTEIHTDFVDCVRFYGDLIISRSAKENKILLWRIDNFSSLDAPPSPSSAPIPAPAFLSNLNSTQNDDSSGTRSAWGGRFQRLLQFDAPLTNLFYMRFGLFHEINHNPILVMGNERSKIFFWDLAELEQGVPVASMAPPKLSKKGKEKEGPSLARLREESIAESATSGASETTSRADAQSMASFSVSGKGKGKMVEVARSAIGDPFHPIQAHKSVVVGKVTFATRQVAWSRGGEWCVVVGDCGMICLFKRWD